MTNFLKIQFFFTSNMSWLNYPFWRGREEKQKRKMGQVKSGGSRRERGRSEYLRSSWERKDHIHSNSKLRKEKYYRNYCLLPLSKHPCIVLKLSPSKSFVLFMYFQPDGRRDDSICQRGTDQSEKINPKLFRGINTIKLLTMVHLSTQH